MRAPVSGATAVAGVVGSPIAHSLSPALHNAWLAAAGIDAVYVAFAPPAAGFAPLVAGLARGGALGLNVTAPFKAEALALAGDASPAARRAGAANLLLFGQDGRVTADNTDGEGLIAAFAAQAPAFALARAPALILGSGGAARGAAAALVAAGATEVWIAARDRARGEALAELLGPPVRALPPGGPGGLSPLALINATPSGLDAAGGAGVDLAALPAGSTVMDMVYAPLETPLLAQARGLGLATVDGLEMLIGQARPSFRALFGQAPPALDARAVALARAAR